MQSKPFTKSAVSIGGSMADNQAYVVYLANPMALGTSTKTPIKLGKRRRVDKVLRQNGFLHSACKVSVNGEALDSKSIKRSWLRNGDVVHVVNVAGDPASVYAAVVAVIGAAATDALIQIAISYAINYLLQAYSGGGKETKITEANNIESYSVSGGGNQYRQFQPLQVVLGTHRLYPDYGSRWTVDYIDDVKATRPILYMQHTFQNYSNVNFSFPVTEATQLDGLGWESYQGAERIPINAGESLRPYVLRDMTLYGLPANPAWGTQGGVYYFGDNVPSHIHFNAPSTSFTIDRDYPDTLIIKWVAPDIGKPWQDNVAESLSCASIFAIDRASPDFISRWSDNGVFGWDEKVGPWKIFSIHWFEMPFAALSDTTPADVVDVGKSYYEKTQRLTNIFNYGFGDLYREPSQDRIGTNKAMEHYGEDLWIEPQRYKANATTFNETWYFANNTNDKTKWPSDVEAVEGGGVVKVAGKDGEWLARQTSRKQANYLELDFGGRLYYSNDSGITLNIAQFEIEYKIVTDSGWTVAPVSPLTISNADTNQVRETIGWTVPQGHYEIRVRSLSDLPSDTRSVVDVSLEAHKAFNIDETTYRGENRLGVIINASKRISGALSRWSSLMSAKTWVFKGGNEESPSLPSASWAWDATENPAWWFLYWCLGGYLDENLGNSNLAHPLHGKYWMLGKRTGVETGQLLFGCGLGHEEINYAELKRWADYCSANNLRCNGVVDTGRPAIDVLHDIARAGRASVSWPGGKLAVVFKQSDDISVQMFGMANIVAGSFSIDYITERTADEVVITYADRDEDYGSKQVSAIVPGISIPSLRTELTLPFVTYKNQAQREANLIAAEQYYNRRRISWKADAEGLVCSKWDVVSVAHDLLCGTQSGRIGSFKLSENTGQKTVTHIAVNEDVWFTPYRKHYMQLRSPEGIKVIITLGNHAGTTRAGDYMEVDAIETCTDAFCPSILDEYGLENPAKPDAQVTTVPEDYIYFISDSRNAFGLGKRLRILSIEPDENKEVRIVATDEDTDFYTWENGNGILPTPIQAPVAQQKKYYLSKLYPLLIKENILASINNVDLIGVEFAEQESALFAGMNIHSVNLHESLILKEINENIISSMAIHSIEMRSTRVDGAAEANNIIASMEVHSINMAVTGVYGNINSNDNTVLATSTIHSIILI
jgi:sulfur carrier protein ThiS